MIFRLPVYFFLATLTGIWQDSASANGWEHQAIPAPVLLDALTSDVAAYRGHAARSLGIKGVSSAVPRMLEMLADPGEQPSVLAEVFFALGRIGDRRAVAPLMDFVANSPRAVNRMDAAHALGILHAAESAPTLVKALSDPDFRVANAALDALGFFDSPIALDALLRTLETAAEQTTRLRAIRSLGRVGKAEAVARLLAFMAPGTGRSQQVAVITALGRIGSEKAAQPLQLLLQKSQDPELKARIVIALASIHTGDATTALIESLGDPIWEVRYFAILGLQQRKAPEVAGKLAMIYRAEQRVLDAALAGPRLDAKIADRSLRMQQAVLRTSLESNPAANLMLFVAGTKSVPLRPDSADALHLLELIHERRRIATVALGYTRAPDALPLLRNLVADPHHSIRTSAVRSFGVLGDGAGVEYAARRIDDSSAEVRWTLADVLGRVRTKNGVQELLQLLKDAHSQVRVRAATSLGLLRAAQARVALAAQADNDSHPSVRQAAHHALNLIRQNAESGNRGD